MIEGEVEGSDQAGVCESSEKGKGEEEGGADEGGNGGEEAAESAEECADADQDLEGDGDDAKDVETGYPFGGSLFVVIQSVVRAFSEEGITELSVEAPNVLGIEPEVELPTGAELDALGVLLIDCKRRPSHAVAGAGAIVPEGNSIVGLENDLSIACLDCRVGPIVRRPVGETRIAKGTRGIGLHKV